MVEPRITMPICRGFVETLIEIKSVAGLKQKEKITPKKTAIGAFPM
jgi:hypothetical protein